METQPFTWNELLTIFKSETPSHALRRMMDEASLIEVLPEIAQLHGVPQPVAHHPEGHAFEHTMQVLDEMRKLTDNPAYLMAALCHDVGKGITKPELLPKHHNHEKNGAPIAKFICNRLGVPEDVKQATIVGTENHGKFHRIMEMRTVRLVDFLDFTKGTSLGIEGLALLGLCDHRGRNNPDGNHACFAPWFEAAQYIEDNPVRIGERKEDARVRQANGINKILKKHK